MDKILKTYLNRLTNLSGNNRSLLLLRLISDQTIDLHQFDNILEKSSFSIISDLIAQKRNIRLCKEVDTHDQDNNKISDRLKRIRRIDDFIFQERGAKDLYIGWPFIAGKFLDDTLVKCPLVFFPVELKSDGKDWSLSLRQDVNITLNKSFLLAYAYFNKIDLDEDLIEQVLNHLDSDSTVFRTQLYEIIKNSAIEVNFNQDNFIDELKPFKNSKKSDLEKIEQSGKLKMYPEAVLGIFPQAGSYLVPDYVKLLENEEGGDINSFFASQTEKNAQQAQKVRYSDKVKEENTYTPFDLDASQEAALNKIKAGNSLVIQGPPGTGKSQLISNLICDYIARGKNVLLVCQKKAALDVVHERLRSKELHDFVGLVHDFKNDRKTIFEKIAHQIDSIDDYKQKNNSLDAIYLERKFLQSSRVIDASVEELDEFKLALFDEKECGKSIKELYLISSPKKSVISLNQDYREFNFEALHDFIPKVKRFIDYEKLFDKKDLFWKEGPSFAEFDTNDLLTIKEITDDVLALNKQLITESKEFVKNVLDYETVLHFATHRDQIKQLINNLDNDQVFDNYKRIRSFEPLEDKDWIVNKEKSIMQCFKGLGMETTLASSELGRFQEALEHAIRSRNNLFQWLRWKLFSKDKIFITRVLIANNLKSDRLGFKVLLEKMDNRLNYEHILSELTSFQWLNKLPSSFRKIEIQNWFFYQKLGLKSYKTFKSIRSLGEYISVKDNNREQYISALNKLLAFTERLPVQQALWSRYLSDIQIRTIILEKRTVEDLQQELTQYFDQIVEYDQIKSKFTSGQQKLLNEIYQLEDIQHSQVIDVIINSVAVAWINHIEIKYPILRAVSSLKLDHLTKELQQGIADKTDASQEIVLLKVREKTYDKLEYNRLNNLVSYRDLYHQVTKKRKVWPIRKVINQFSEELFSLIPCWMASPESSSAIFPMKEMFDLVIFDEASQCFAERGIPAMYRGKQVVIAGDDKQLRPNDLYRVKWEDDSEEHPALDAESLLELSKQYISHCNLTGHYRSKALSLIHFSNEHFYEGRLKMLPHFVAVNSETPAIELIKVDGIWENSSNEIEADMVIDIISKRHQINPNHSIGVVTFNVSQQNLILDKLELADFPMPENLFVKNIENVQGDERDVIIFSSAYGNDPEGKLQLRFGSLNAAGGENRLNVAITRAKEKIIFITSLEPSQLKVEDSKNLGPKLLKAYLTYAKEVSENRWKPNKSIHINKNQDWYLSTQIIGSEDSLIKELPYADVTVKSPDEYKGLILTDDDLFYQTLSSKEAYAYRFHQLTEKNWQYINFYSREFWLDKGKFDEKLNKFVFRISQ
ncbi:MAG: archaellum biogenesis ATPase FlaH [Cyclobacteriaceae bacterium]|jgi:archaellum biogenesis ATPase FlaH